MGSHLWKAQCDTLQPLFKAQTLWATGLSSTQHGGKARGSNWGTEGAHRVFHVYVLDLTMDCCSLYHLYLSHSLCEAVGWETMAMKAISMLTFLFSKWFTIQNWRRSLQAKNEKRTITRTSWMDYFLPTTYFGWYKCISISICWYLSISTAIDIDRW